MSSRQVSKVQPEILLCRTRSCAGLSDMQACIAYPSGGQYLLVLQVPGKSQLFCASSQDTSLRCSVRCGPTGHQALYCWGHRAPSARLVHCSSIQSFLYRGLHQVRSPHSQHLSLQPCWAGPGAEDAIWNILIHSCQMPMVSSFCLGVWQGKVGVI